MASIILDQIFRLKVNCYGKGEDERKKKVNEKRGTSCSDEDGLQFQLDKADLDVRLY